MTLVGPDLFKPPGHLLLQYDTWRVVSRGVLQNVSSRLSRRKPFQAEFRIRQDNIQFAAMHVTKCAHVTWDLTVQPLLAEKRPLPESTIAVEKQGAAPGSSDYFQI
jgi:hypothetical protein